MGHQVSQVLAVHQDLVVTRGEVDTVELRAIPASADSLASPVLAAFQEHLDSQDRVESQDIQGSAALAEILDIQGSPVSQASVVSAVNLASRVYPGFQA